MKIHILDRQSMKATLDLMIIVPNLKLTEHCFYNHPDQMELSVFKVGIVKKCRAIDLDREEDRFISKFRTNVFGLNRMIVSR